MIAMQSGYAGRDEYDTLGSISSEIGTMVQLAETAANNGDCDSARKIGLVVLRKCASLGEVLEAYLGSGVVSELRARARRVVVGAQVGGRTSVAVRRQAAGG